MLVRKIPVYDFGELALSPIESTDFLKDKFYIAFPTLPAFIEEKPLLSVGGVLTVRVKCRSFTDDTSDIASLKREECFYFNDENEWILEAECHMKTADGTASGEYTVCLPLSAPFAKAPFALVFDGTWLRFVQNGEVLNENAGLAAFMPETDEVFIDKDILGVVASPIKSISVSYREKKTDTPTDVFFPYGFNTTIGDVMNFAKDGTYHVIYLLDRRHHGSRGGLGAHYFAHLTTTDFVDWYE